MLTVPLAARLAPLGSTELAQPLPAMPGFVHGQGVPEPSPKQNGVVGVDGLPTWICAHTMSKALTFVAGCCVEVVPSVTVNVTLRFVLTLLQLIASGKSSSGSLWYGSSGFASDWLFAML